MPRVTFTDPEIGSVGLTEAEARAAGRRRDRVCSEPIAAVGPRLDPPRVRASSSWSARDGVLVGATSMGPSGGEVLGLLALAVHAQVPLETLRTMIFAYPTFHRAVDSALWSAHRAAQAKMAGA